MNAIALSPVAGSNSEVSAPWPLRLWLVDDNKSVLDLMADLLGAHEALLCPRRFGSAEETIEALKHETPPDAILMDLNMGGMSGIDAIAPIRARAPQTRVFIMTTFYDGLQAARAARSGAAAFLLKGAPVEQLVETLRSAPAETEPFGSAESHVERAGAAAGKRRQPSPWLPRAVHAIRTLLAGKKSPEAALEPAGCTDFSANMRTAESRNWKSP